MNSKTSIFNRNVLKFIAFATMLSDHAAVLLFDGFLPLRIIGRLSFPIFAYMISEGCRYTSNRRRYFLRLFVLGVLCNLIYFIASKQLTFSILITFSLSILLISAVDAFRSQRENKRIPALPVLGMIALIAVSYFLGGITSPLRAFGVTLDYGILGVLTPVLLYCLPEKWEKLVMLGAAMIAETLCTEWYQIFSLLSIPLLYFYNGEPGSPKWKYFFYLGYPLHLLLLAALSMFL